MTESIGEAAGGYEEGGLMSVIQATYRAYQPERVLSPAQVAAFERLIKNERKDEA